MGKKILVVDDESSVVTALHRELHPWTVERGLKIISAESGDAAFRLVQKDPKNIAVVIADLRMPGLSGTELLTKVCIAYPHIMTLLLTGHTDAKDMIQAIKSGVFSYILKPWDRQQLLNEVRNAFDLYVARERNEREQEMLRDDLTWAGELQQKLLSVKFPSSHRITYSVASRAKNEFGISGDYYDVIELDENRHLILIGDVAGHGVKSAFITFVLRTLLNSEPAVQLVGEGGTVAGLVEWVNRRICRELRDLPDIVVTFAACLVDLTNMQIICVNSGNPYFYILRDGRSIPIKLPSVPLGFMADTHYEEYVEQLVPGDRLLFFTDGIAEQLTIEKLDSSAPENQDDVEGARPDLQQILRAVADEAELAPAFVEAVMAAINIYSFPDDITVLSAEIAG